MRHCGRQDVLGNVELLEMAALFGLKAVRTQPNGASVQQTCAVHCSLFTAIIRAQPDVGFRVLRGAIMKIGTRESHVQICPLPSLPQQRVIMRYFVTIFSVSSKILGYKTKLISVA
jgi:hypothetical protein